MRKLFSNSALCSQVRSLLTPTVPKRSIFRPYFGSLQKYSYKKSSDENSPGKMVDPQRVVSYEHVLKTIDQPKKVLIDVREPDEIESSGKIPSSINIPLHDVDNVLCSMTREEFQKQYKRQKPNCSDELIFYCRSGRRSTEALDKALKLGYTNSKTYLGSWNEWSDKHK